MFLISILSQILLRVKIKHTVISKTGKKYPKMKEKKVLNKFTKEKLMTLVFLKTCRRIYLLVLGMLKFQIRVMQHLVVIAQPIDPDVF